MFGKHVAMFCSSIYGNFTTSSPVRLSLVGWEKALEATGLSKDLYSKVYINCGIRISEDD